MTDVEREREAEGAVFLPAGALAGFEAVGVGVDAALFEGASDFLALAAPLPLGFAAGVTVDEVDALDFALVALVDGSFFFFGTVLVGASAAGTTLLARSPPFLLVPVLLVVAGGGMEPLSEVGRVEECRAVVAFKGAFIVGEEG